MSDRSLYVGMTVLSAKSVKMGEKSYAGSGSGSGATGFASLLLHAARAKAKMMPNKNLMRFMTILQRVRIENRGRNSRCFHR